MTAPYDPAPRRSPARAMQRVFRVLSLVFVVSWVVRALVWLAGSAPPWGALATVALVVAVAAAILRMRRTEPRPAVPGEDPGWQIVPTHVPRAEPARGLSQLAQLRAVFVSFAVSIVLVGVVAAILDGSDAIAPSDVPAALPIGVAAVGAAGLVMPGVIRRPFVCENQWTVAGSYTTFFFLRVAFSEVPALAAFVGVAVTGRAWVYLVGLVPTLAGLARAAPTSANIAREQERLTLAGCPHSLLDGLTRKPPDQEVEA